MIYFFILLINLATSFISNFSGETVFDQEICYEFPWYKNRSLANYLIIETVYYNFSVQNNICNSFVVLLPSYNWNLICINNCSSTLIKPYNSLWGICLKSFGKDDKVISTGSSKAAFGNSSLHYN